MGCPRSPTGRGLPVTVGLYYIISLDPLEYFLSPPTALQEILVASLNLRSDSADSYLTSLLQIFELTWKKKDGVVNCIKMVC